MLRSVPFIRQLRGIKTLIMYINALRANTSLVFTWTGKKIMLICNMESNDSNHGLRPVA